MVRTCQHHEHYTPDEQVRCKVHGICGVSACSSCKDFILKPQPKRDKKKPPESPAKQTGFQCVHLGAKRRCCQDLFLCKKFPGESCNPSGTIPAAIQCSACPEYKQIEPQELWPAIKVRPSTENRVGFLSASYMKIGGTETFHRSLLPRLKQTTNVSGFAATAFYGGDGSELAVPYGTGVAKARQLAAHCDVLVVWGIQDLIQVLPFNRPKVIAVHHADWSSEWSNEIILNQLDLIDVVICVNKDTSEKLVSCGKPVHYVPNAIDPDRLAPSGNQINLRTEFGIPASSKIVLFGHRMSEEKRPSFAVDIARHLPDGWTMVIAGDGPELENTRAAAAKCSNVRVVGACDSLADWLAISDRFLSLSTFEGFGLSIGEAMAAGVPTISTPTGIAPGLANILPTDSSAAEWANAIIQAKVFVTPSEILERFSVQRMVDSWANVINSMKA